MEATDCFGERGANVDLYHLWRPQELAAERDAVGAHNFGELASIDSMQGVAAKDAVGDDGDDALGSVLHEGLGCLDEGSAGVCHVVDQNALLVLNDPDEDHIGHFVGSLPLFVDESELEVEVVCHVGGPFCTSRVGADDHCVGHIDVVANVRLDQRLCHQVVDWHGEEALDLGSVQIEDDDVVGPGGLKHVGHEFGGDWHSSLVFSILAGVGEQGNNRGDPAGRGLFAGINHDQHLHHEIVDMPVAGLEDEDVLVSEGVSTEHGSLGAGQPDSLYGGHSDA